MVLSVQPQNMAALSEAIAGTGGSPALNQLVHVTGLFSNRPLETEGQTYPYDWKTDRSGHQLQGLF
jgi:hypothetical protein